MKKASVKFTEAFFIIYHNLPKQRALILDRTRALK
jgi:hypothetical protein